MFAVDLISPPSPQTSDNRHESLERLVCCPAASQQEANGGGANGCSAVCRLTHPLIGVPASPAMYKLFKVALIGLDAEEKVDGYFCCAHLAKGLWSGKK